MSNPTGDALMARIKELEKALECIDTMPYSQVNDSESLRHTIKAIQFIARKALNK